MHHSIDVVLAAEDEAAVAVAEYLDGQGLNGWLQLLKE